MASAVRKRLAGARKTVTLDIDAGAVRLLETRGRKVTRWASLALGPGDVKDGVLSDPKALGSLVKQLLATSGIGGGKVAASISGLYSVSRILTVPGRPGAEAPQAATEAARAAMPLDTEKLYLTWQTIAALGGVQQVFVMGVPREVIDSEVRALQAAGLTPQSLRLKAMALARAVDREQALILNIEPSTLDIVLVVNGMCESMRTTAWRQDGMAPEDRADQLIRTVDLTVNYFNSHHPESPLDAATPLFITGQASADPALMERVQARSGYPIEPLTPPLECPAQLPVSQYAVNIGLALLGDTPSPGAGRRTLPDVSLLPGSYLPWKPSATLLYAAVSVIAAVALFLFLYQFTGGAMARTAELQQRHQALNAEMQQRQTESRSRIPLQKSVEEYRAILSMDSGVTGEMELIVSEATRLGVQVESVAHKGDSISVEARAPDYNVFRAYLAALEKTGKFASITPPPEGYPFTTGGKIELKPKPRK